MIRKFLSGTFALFAVFLFVSCVTLRRPQLTPEDEAVLYPVSSYIPESFDWQEVCPGISRFDYKNPGFPIIYHAVKIDLSLAGLSLTCFPDASQPQAENFRSIRTKTFAARNNCVVAVNLSPFTGKNGAWNLAAKLGSQRTIVGLHVVDGQILSAAVPKYAAISFRKETSPDGLTTWRAFIDKSQSEKTAANRDYAFGGFYVVLEQGVVQTGYNRTHDSRTGAGISDDGRTLYLLVVEGENTLVSEGLSYPQCGEIFKAMGCTDALEMDGGGSSELCINGRSVLSYNNLRTQANSLGFVVKQDSAQVIE